MYQLNLKLLSFFPLFMLFLAPPATAANPLNLLFITVDDMNADSSGWMGSKMGATPALDALAAQSHRFINNHVTAPICMPSREAIMTGRVPHRSGGFGFDPINPGTSTMVTILKAAGYYTAAINKTSHMKPAAEFPWDDTIEGSGKNPTLLRKHFETTLRNANTAGKPFFINLNIQYPHRPFPQLNHVNLSESTKVKEKSKGQKNNKKASKIEGVQVADGMRVYKADEVQVPSVLEDIPLVREEVAQYFTAVARMDVAIKSVLNALQASSHAEDTIVLFMSDHGMSCPFSTATVYHNGTHSPVIIKYPGMPAVITHDEMVSSVDIMPTLLDLLGVKQPEGMDGRSWLSLIQGEKQADRDFVITHVNTTSSGASQTQRCIRTKEASLMFHGWTDGTAKFKVEAMSGISYKALAEAGKTDNRIDARVKQYRVGEPLMFFKETNDTSERINLIADPNFKAEIHRLATLLITHMEKTDDPEQDNFKKAIAEWNK